MRKKQFTIFVVLLLLFSSVTIVNGLAMGTGSNLDSAPAGALNIAGVPNTDNFIVPARNLLISGWEQVNVNGFGDPNAGEVSALAEFNSYLYAGTSNPVAGARIFRSPDGLAWTPIIDPGFGITHDTAPPAILDLMVFKTRLYASTGRGDGPGQIWRTVNGVNWAPMTISGFGNPDTVDISALAEFNGWIYAGARNLVSGAQIWRSFSGDSNTWTKVAPAVSSPAASTVTGFGFFNGALYAAIESAGPVQIWRSYGSDWTTMVSNGFGDGNTKSSGGMATFGAYLYVGAGNDVEGAQLWRTSNGTGWEQAISPGFGDPNNQKVEAVYVFQNKLYAGVNNNQTGIELWRSADGATWEQANPDGCGDVNNTGSNGSNATAEFLGDLYLGTSNTVNGGELWRYQSELPPPTTSPTPGSTPTTTPTTMPSPTPTSQPTPGPQSKIYLPVILGWP